MGARHWSTFRVVNPVEGIVAVVASEVHPGAEWAEQIERLIAGLPGD